jgi:hypothetical protein
MTPAEWRAEEGVVVVDVVARRLRGNQRALLHGNDDVGEWSVGGAATQERGGCSWLCTEEWRSPHQVSF